MLVEKLVDGRYRQGRRQTEFGLKSKVFKHKVVAEWRYMSEGVCNDVEIIVLFDIIKSNKTYISTLVCPHSQSRAVYTPGIYFFFPKSHFVTTSLSSFLTFSLV